MAESSRGNGPITAHFRAAELDLEIRICCSALWPLDLDLDCGAKNSQAQMARPEAFCCAHGPVLKRPQVRRDRSESVSR